MVEMEVAKVELHIVVDAGALGRGRDWARADWAGTVSRVHMGEVEHGSNCAGGELIEAGASSLVELEIKSARAQGEREIDA